MTKRFVVETESGSLYLLEDATAVLGQDVWFIHTKHGKQPIFFIGKEKKHVPGILQQHIKQQLRGVNPTEEIFIRILEGTVSEALLSGACIGQMIYYLSVSDFEKALPFLGRLEEPHVWRVIRKSCGNTTKIKHIYGVNKLY